MITVEKAHRILARSVPRPKAKRVRMEEALGCVLAENVKSDIEMPPFRKAMMDGFAVVASDAPGALKIIEEIAAGRMPRKKVKRGVCSRIMTGAPVPDGATAVIRVEDTSEKNGTVRIRTSAKRGQHIARKAQDLRVGEIVLRKGTLLRPSEIGILAAVGHTRPRVYPRPSCAVLVTGDELVPPERKPGPGRIRNSNAFSIGAQLRTMGFEARDLGVAKDTVRHLTSKVRQGLKHDVLILSGGVSMGKLDYVVPVMKSLGVKKTLYKVKIKPGKPLFIGAKGRTRVFALPGNPVSTFVLFEVFVRPYLCRMMGRPVDSPTQRAKLDGRVRRNKQRVQYLPARIRNGKARPLSWHGSADLFALPEANGFIVVPVGKQPRTGAEVGVYLLP